MSDPLDILFTRLRTSPFAGVDPNSVPQEGRSDIEATGFVNVVENADRGVIIDSDGITINFGSLTLKDQFGSNVITGAGFGASWQDFISEGFYNGHFAAGSTADIVAATEIGGADTEAEYILSLSEDIPYWVVQSESGAGTLKRVADSTAVGGFALQWDGNENAIVYQDIPILANRKYTLFMSWRWTNSTSEFSREIGYQFRDASHGAIGSEIDSAISYTDTQATYIEEYVARTSEAPANARYLRVFLHFSRTSGSPTVWLNAVRAQHDFSGATFIRSTGGSLAALGIYDDLTGGLLQLSNNSDTFATLGLLGGNVPGMRLGPGGTTVQDIYIYRYDLADKTLYIDNDQTHADDLNLVSIRSLAVDFNAALMRGFSGTSFPASPTTGDRFFRTDLGVWCFYDGTRWLTEQIFVLPLTPLEGASASPLAATAVNYNQSPAGATHPSASDLYLLQHRSAFIVSGGGSALSASHKWVGTAQKYSAALAAATFATANIDSGASGTARTINTTINALMNDGTARFLFATTWTKTGTPGALQVQEIVTYRAVYT